MTTRMMRPAGPDEAGAARSGICHLDADRGVLAYRGHDIHDLADRSSFEETCYLLWHGRLPNRAELGDLQSQFVAARPLPEGILRLMRSLPSAAGLDALQTTASALAAYDPDAGGQSSAARLRASVRLTAQLAGVVAASGRLSAGRSPIAPDPALGHAANFLYMLTGERPHAPATRGLDVSLVLHAEHGFDASTVAARAMAATETDVCSAITSAIGTLKGPLYGSAAADVMRLLLEIGPEANGLRIMEMIGAGPARGGGIPGFGRGVYRVEDPRTAHLRRLSRDLGQRAGSPPWFQALQRVEALMKTERGLSPDVDFHTASIYYSMGIPIELFPSMFAVGRVSGWTAHVLEQYAGNRPIRPRAEYTGPAYPQIYVPLEQR